MGGATMLVDEADILFPVGTSRVEARTLYRRSRHAGLSVISTTTRPGNISREVTAQCTQLLAMNMAEPSDVEFVAGFGSWTKSQLQQWREWVFRNPQGGLWQQVRTGQRLWLPDSGPAQPDRHSVQLSLIARGERREGQEDRPA